MSSKVAIKNCFNKKPLGPLKESAVELANEAQPECTTQAQRQRWMDIYISAGGAWESMDPKGSEIGEIVAPCPYDDPVPELTSHYCHEQLKLMAKRQSEGLFIASMVSVFGKEIPGRAYRQLYRDLSDGSLPLPQIQVHRGLIKGHLAAYNKKDRKIHIAEELVYDAVDKQLANDVSGKLFMVLLEEYGHYIDDLLRNNYYGKVGGDAKGDEGAIFAYRFVTFDISKSPRLHFADVISKKYGGALDIDYTELHHAAKKHANLQQQVQDDKDGDWEFFGAGYGHTENHKSLAHRSIELVLAEVGFDEKKDLPRIYFGNWLRDFSQIIDPAIVRPADYLLAKAQKKYKQRNNSVHNSPAEDGIKLSRQTLTKMVGLLALTEFKEDGAELAKQFSSLLFSDRGMKVLGGYRPEEHIDNPMPGPLDEISHWVDNSQVDPFFAKPPILQQLDINKKTGLKNYIATAVTGQTFPTAVEYMEDRLTKAMAAGNTDEGLRYFGEGLHVLEDFFAHSNFVEISLIKIGKTKVYPWVDVPQGAQRIPLVTGLFGRTDVIASLAPKLAELIPNKMEPYDTIPSGHRTETDKLILLLLEDLDQSQALDSTEASVIYKGEKNARLTDQYNEYLLLRDSINSGKENEAVRIALEAKHTAFQAILVAINYPLSTVAGPLSHYIDDMQVWVDKFQNKSVGTNPTHSQLAKDHDNHHFHELAALLAKEAVRGIGARMKSHFDHKPTVSPISTAKKFIVHPLDTDWMDPHVRDWANVNPKKILRGQSMDEVSHLHHMHGKKVEQFTETMKQEIDNIKSVFNDLYRKYWSF